MARSFSDVEAELQALGSREVSAADAVEAAGVSWSSLEQVDELLSSLGSPPPGWEPRAVVRTSRAQEVTVVAERRVEPERHDDSIITEEARGLAGRPASTPAPPVTDPEIFGSPQEYSDDVDQALRLFNETEADSVRPLKERDPFFPPPAAATPRTDGERRSGSTPARAPAGLSATDLFDGSPFGDETPVEAEPPGSLAPGPAARQSSPGQPDSGPHELSAALEPDSMAPPAAASEEELNIEDEFDMLIDEDDVVVVEEGEADDTLLEESPFRPKR